MGLLRGGGKAGLRFAEGNIALTLTVLNHNATQRKSVMQVSTVPSEDNLPSRGLQCNAVPSITRISLGCLQTTGITVWEMQLWQPAMQELQAWLSQTSFALHTAAKLLCRLPSPHRGAQLSLRLSAYCWHRLGWFELCQLSAVIHPSRAHVPKHAQNQHISTYIWFVGRKKRFSCHCCGLHA